MACNRQIAKIFTYSNSENMEPLAGGIVRGVGTMSVMQLSDLLTTISTGLVRLTDANLQIVAKMQKTNGSEAHPYGQNILAHASAITEMILHMVTIKMKEEMAQASNGQSWAPAAWSEAFNSFFGILSQILALLARANSKNGKMNVGAFQAQAPTTVLRACAPHADQTQLAILRDYIAGVSGN